MWSSILLKMRNEINPFTSRSDQYATSPYNINTLLSTLLRQSPTQGYWIDIPPNSHCLSIRKYMALTKGDYYSDIKSVINNKSESTTPTVEITSAVHLISCRCVSRLHWQKDFGLRRWYFCSLFSYSLPNSSFGLTNFRLRWASARIMLLPMPLQIL